jgi:transcriptional regulator with XRE-family HTH domain
VTIGKRLKEERDRLGFSQPAFSSIAGTTKKSQIDYEKDITQPKAGYLAAVAAVGVDVAYVITGMRSMPVTKQQSKPLNREEEILLDNYRHSSPKAQAAIKATSDALAQREVNKKIS